MQKKMYVLEEKYELVGVVTERNTAKQWFNESPMTRNFCELPVMDKTFSQMVTQNNAYEG